MAIKPILFSTPMVQAILEQRKKQTRRVCDHQYWSFSELVNFNENGIHKRVDQNVSSKYQIGDILWVRETFRNDALGGFDYKANYSEGITSHPKNKGIWKPSIFMPKQAARIFLEVNNVRVERLWDLSHNDAIAEGISGNDNDGYVNYLFPAARTCAKVSFESLWIKINGTESWDTNPWVFVYDFKRINKPKDF